MNRLDYNRLNDELLHRIPEFASGFAHLQRLWGESEEPGPHVVYGDLLVPYLEQAARAGKPTAGVQSALDLLEEMAGSFDEEIRSVVGASVLEPLNGHPEARLKLRQWMGPATRSLAEQIEQAWGS